MSSDADDLAHLMMHQATQQTQNMEMHLQAHCIEYDPKTSHARFVVPVRQGVDGESYETNWVPCAGFAVGDGWGFQWAPEGGATQDDPTKGEQCTLSITNRGDGIYAHPNYTYGNMVPPGAGANGDTQGDPDGQNLLQGGECVMRFKKGAFLKFYANGDIQAYAAQDLIVRAQRDMNVTVIEGNMNVDIQQGNLSATVEQGDATIEVPIGDTLIESNLGNIVASTNLGDVAVNSDQGAVSVTAGLDVSIAAGLNVTIDAAEQVLVNGGIGVTVTAPIVELLSPVVNLGAGALQFLLNEVFMLTKYNEHTHPVLGAVTGPPDLLGVPGIDSTIDTAAS